MLDRYDRAILRLLLRYKDNELATYFIARELDVSPLTAKRHLSRLLKMGYVLYKRVGKIRNYKGIKSPPKIMWRLRYKK